MQLLDLTLPSAAENLALDEALLREAEAGQGREVLRLWEWPGRAVVLGAGCRLAEDVHERDCTGDGVPVLRRASGGGTVLLGPGCLCYSLVLAYARDPALGEIGSSYAYILDTLAATLRPAVPGVERAGTSDLAVAGRKFSGNSQQRKRSHLLHHGTLLYAFDLAQVGRYLHLPSRRPEYRGQRGHAEFLCNLPLSAGELRRLLRQCWRAVAERTDWPRETVARLVEERYARPEWTARR